MNFLQFLKKYIYLKSKFVLILLKYIKKHMSLK